MTTPLQQINVSIRIIDSTTVDYSYVDPSTQQYVTSDTCDLLLYQPSCCLFLLDAETSSNGWTITSVMPNGTQPINFTPGPFNLSVATHCSPKEPMTYKYYIVYYNTQTNLTYFIDPQEVNIPPMTCPE